MSVEKKVPEIRFNCFEGEWTLSKLDDVADFYDELRKPITENARESGPYPYYGASGIIDYVKDYIFDEEMILLSEDGANILDRNYRVCFLASGKYWVNNHAHVVKAKRGNNNLFICETLERLRYDKYNTGTAQPKINQDVCKNLPLYTTSNDEQTAIGNYFQKLDSLINQHQQKHDKLSNLKRAMLEKMFPKQGETVPEIRFKGFSGEWVESPLNKIAMDITDGNWIEAEHIFDNGEYRIIQTGNIGVGQYLDRLKHAKYFHQSNFDAVRGNEIFPGDILISRLADPAGRAVILPDTGYRMVTAVDVAIVRPESCFHSYFLMILLNRKEALKSVGEWVSGTSHKRISHANLVKVKFVVPCVEEQSRIGDYFQKLDTLINQHQQQITKLTNIKQACLSKMFV
jgi:type I restriction enzyme S subunit